MIIINSWGDNRMEGKLKTLFDYIKSLSNSDLDRIINFVMGIFAANTQPKERPDCPYCGNTHVIKYGHRKGKQRFLCHDCKQTFMFSTNTLMAYSHFSQSVWADFIRDTLRGESLDYSADEYGLLSPDCF